MHEKDYTVRVALREDLSEEEVDEGRRRLKSQLIRDEKSRLMSSAKRQHWSFPVKASSLDEAAARATRMAAEAFTDVDPQAEVVAITWYGESF